MLALRWALRLGMLENFLWTHVLQLKNKSQQSQHIFRFSPKIETKLNHRGFHDDEFHETRANSKQD